MLSRYRACRPGLDLLVEGWLLNPPMATNSGSTVRRINSPSASVSTVSTSPRPTSLSRPHWPWTPHTRTHNSSPSLPPATSPAMNWDAGSSSSMNAWTAATRQSAGSVQGSVSHLQAEETIRQWNFTAFEWTVRNVHALRDFVEHEQIPNATEGPEEPHEVLRVSPMLGDGKFKLEIVRTTHEPEVAITTPTLPPSSFNEEQSLPVVNAKTNLSLCVTSLMLDLAQGLEYDVTIVAALKVQDDRGGERGARADWVWEYWEKDWSFRQDSEVWECSLPALSTLLDNPRISETDSFVICIQIHSPAGPQFPQHPSAYYVPRDLLDGVEASLDNPRDVKFICLERLSQSSNPGSPMIPASPLSPRSSSEASGYSSAAQSTARKRVIYAHSDILIRRSEYFQTMLTSSFSENVNVPSGDRKIYEIVVEEADFVTIYWLLKYCYANWVLFKEHDDPRASVDRMGEGWSAKWLSNRSGGEWDWKRFSKAGFYDDASAGSRDDEGNDRSVRSTGSPVGGRTPSSSQGKRPPSAGRGVSMPTSPAPSSSRISSRLTMPGAGGRAGVTGQSVNSPQGVPNSSKASSTRQSSASSTRAAPVSGPGYTYPVSPRQMRQQQQHNTLDPHPHPTPPPPPGSALSIWLTAHRYAMPGLSSLALTHMMNTIQPSTAFSLLLATSRWEELHILVEDYIVDQWDLACNSEEFERCCQEVAMGEWGPEGGKTFAALFRRLRSR
ncbi:hypothetical protein JB92DRAFT_3045758 [Gautieria morchelliformis]|nr:hypothetical protein JB92DRAFT_3045758 [Gautieria morchelliformis]